MFKNAKKILVLGVVIGSSAIGAGAYAMSSSTSPPSPYTGGASISRVFYPADGSTVTITCTGAVIKQSPGHTPYREGWVNTANMGSINSEADLKGQIASGSSNPFGSSNICPSSNQPQPSTSTQPSNPTPQATTPSASATANATANANVVLTGSGPTTTTQTPAQTSTVANTTASTPAQTSSSFSGKSLPNTGPGSVLAFSGVATVLGTIGHFVYQRLRYRSLA